MGVKARSVPSRFLYEKGHLTKPSHPTEAEAVTNTILTHLSGGHLRKAVSILFASPFPFQFSLYAHLFHLCSSSRAVLEARKVESHLVTFSPTPPSFLLNRAIESYAKCESLGDARELFDEVLQRDGGSWNAMIKAYSACSNFRFAEMYSSKYKQHVLSDEVFLFLNTNHGKNVRIKIQIESKTKMITSRSTIP